jgi:hypothetical protein
VANGLGEALLATPVAVKFEHFLTCALGKIGAAPTPSMRFGRLFLIGAGSHRQPDRMRLELPDAERARR